MGPNGSRVISADMDLQGAKREPLTFSLQGTMETMFRVRLIPEPLR